jgi:hypothetical protein
MKPTKKQKAILSLLNIIDQEGLHYGVYNYGIEDELKAIKDSELTELVRTMQEVTLKLEEKLAEFKTEVEPFLDDDSDF